LKKGPFKEKEAAKEKAAKEEFSEKSENKSLT
jgi:hypothetical protein